MITYDEVTKHNTKEDCWVIIRDQVQCRRLQVPIKPSSRISSHSRSMSEYDILRRDNNVLNIEAGNSLTKFLQMHPGGAQVIINNAGKDVTKIFEPLHPKGIIDEMLEPDQKLGRVDPSSMPEAATQMTDDDIRVLKAKKDKPAINTIINLADMEEVARRVMTQQAWHYYRSDAEDGYSASVASLPLRA